MRSALADNVRAALDRFVNWLERFGETSQDHQDFYASRLGRAAKALYYRRPVLGKLAVLPAVACEAFAPWARRFFYPRMRLPIADAHYAMGFAALHRVSGHAGHLSKAIHYLEVLKATRCSGYDRHGWGYPFDWQTSGGVIPRGTPLITTTPYCYEAFKAVFGIDRRPEWYAIARSTAEHVLRDYRDFEVGPNVATCTYTPTGGQGVVNASAYRSFVLFSAWKDEGDDRYREPAMRNLNFVLQAQREDGSWPYEAGGSRSFIDHFHTCFVMKALAKIETLTDHDGCTRALAHGVEYYLQHLFDEAGLPRPFAKAPRLTLYRRELYDCAECINLGVLLRGRFPELDRATDRTVQELLTHWNLSSGSFRSRRLLFGWDNVPMHRWGQSQVFRSLCLLLAQADGRETAVSPLASFHPTCAA